MTIQNTGNLPFVSPYPLQSLGEAPGSEGISGKRLSATSEEFDLDSVAKTSGGSEDTPSAKSASATDETVDTLTAAEQQMQADLYAFMAVMHKLAQSIKTFSKLQAADDLKAQVDALTAAADEMDEASTKRLKASYIQSAMQVAGGLTQGVAGAMAAGQTLKSAGNETKGRSLVAEANSRSQQLEADAALPDMVDASGQQQGAKVVNPDKLSPIQRHMVEDHVNVSKRDGEALLQSSPAASAKSQALQAVSGGAGSGLGGMGTVASAEETKLADEDEQQKQLREVNAKQSEAEQSVNQQMAQAMQELIADVNQLARQQMEAQANVNSQILRV